MVGLQTVKEGIRTMANQARFHQERRQRGLRSAGGTTYHMVFTGNPGTGKTTVARQLGKIYHSLGLLSKGDLIAVDRTRLVGQYLGQTEDNMKVVLEEARGNVLFIDEAYNLVTNDPDRKDFGHRVIESLLTVLTRPNPDMLVVLAGYAKEMDDMLSSNPGLRSRFPYRYQFEDYSADQLMQIAHHLFEAEDYTLTAEAETELCNVVNQTLRQKHQEFGNARWIEQLVRNGIIPAMADRVFATACTDFQRVEASDVTKAFERLRPQAAPLKSRRHVVAGFSA
jgi:SpoVK/Ycf46/Vps4 family AAA+-type ATPase